MPILKGKTNPYYRHGMYGTRFYKIWSYIKQRTRNPKNIRYHRYGGRGIQSCKRWRNFINFKEDMYKSYLVHSQHHTEKNTFIERINNDGNYEPSNCRWATQAEQHRNTMYNKVYSYNGVTLIMTDWAKIFDIPIPTLWDRLYKQKISFEKAIHFGVPKAQLFNKEKYESIVTDLLEKTFPKGECKERGKALLFIARLWIELEKFSIPKISKERLKEIMSENMFADETPHNPTRYITYNLEDLAAAILKELEKGGST